jgi:SAM-dependent methyltransferase
MTRSASPSGSLQSHFDWVAAHDASARAVQSGFHAQLRAHFRHHVVEGERVLELGCGAGDLLAALRPARGLGVDFSTAMIEKARARHGAQSGLEFRVLDVDAAEWDEPFDHIILDYLTGYLPDIQRVLERLRAAAHPRTRLHLTSLNTLWRGPLRVATALGAVMPQPPSAWLAHSDLINLLELTGWEVVRFERLQLLPFNVPLLSGFFNRTLVRLPFFRHFGITLAFTARPRATPRLDGEI